MAILLAGGCVRTTVSNETARKSTQAPPRRIVSLTPNNTEILFALGLGDRVAGVTSACDYPPEARTKPKVGNASISIERVVALKPDLVVAHSNLNASIVSRLKALRIRVVATDPKSFQDLFSDIRLIGRAAGAIGRAESLVRSMEQSIEAVRKRSAGGRKPRALVVIQSSPLWVAGPETFVDEMIGYSGGENAARDARPGFNTFSVERAVARDPDVIIVTRREDKAFFEGSSIWRGTKAVGSGRVVVIDPALLVRPGPRLVEGLEELAEAMGNAGNG